MINESQILHHSTRGFNYKTGHDKKLLQHRVFKTQRKFKHLESTTKT